jgi:hypothetical protein
MFSFSIGNKFPENNFFQELVKSSSTPVLQQQEKDEGFNGFSDTVSEPGRLRELPGLEFVKGPFKLKRKGSKTSRSAKNMDASDPPSPNASDASLTVPEQGAEANAEVLERPVALSARLR